MNHRVWVGKTLRPVHGNPGEVKPAATGPDLPRRRRAWAALAGLGVCGVLAAALAGCLQPQTRLQKEDEAAREKEVEIKTVGDVTEVSNAGPTVVSGVGLVTGLEGTGGGTPPGSYRTMLENELKKKGLENIREILESENNALVLVSAQIPAAAHKGDPLDVDVTLPPQSKAKSLRGGYLQECVLFNYDTTKNINPNYEGANRYLQGHILAKAKGPLVVGLGDGDEAVKLRHGRVWGGAVSLIDRPFYLTLKNDQQFARIANAVAERLNQTFYEDGRKRLLVLGQVTDRIGDRFSGPGGKAAGSGLVAKAVNRGAVYARVPWEYRHNPARYLRVARLVPLQDTPEVHSLYRKRQEEKLLDPAQTMSAALRLEALGQESIPGLKAGLKSAHPLVRFCAAESLTYLGTPSGAEELARLARNQPNLRAYCLTALASLNEAACQGELVRLLSSPSSETRYGAFRALFILDERCPDIQGEMVGDSVWVHRVAPDSPPLVHLSGGLRPEVILFGKEPHMQPPFYLVAGPEFTATAGPDDNKCTIGRFNMKRGMERRQCSLQLDDVLRTVVDLGGTYADVQDLLEEADKYQCLSCKVQINRLPVARPVEELSSHAKDPEFFKEIPDVDPEPVVAKETPAAPPGGADQGSQETTGPASRGR
jgi:hypothetical protein